MKTNLMAAARRCAPRLIGPALLLATCAALAGGVTNSYDSLGRLSQVLYSNGVKIVYVYDATGNRTSYVVTGSAG